MGPVTCTQLSRMCGGLCLGCRGNPSLICPEAPPGADPTEMGWRDAGLEDWEKTRWTWGSGLLLRLTGEGVAELDRACPVGAGAVRPVPGGVGLPMGLGHPLASRMSL